MALYKKTYTVRLYSYVYVYINLYIHKPHLFRPFSFSLALISRSKINTNDSTAAPRSIGSASNIGCRERINNEVGADGNTASCPMELVNMSRIVTPVTARSYILLCCCCCFFCRIADAQLHLPTAS